MIFRDQQNEKSKMIPGNPMWVCRSIVESLARDSEVRNLRRRLLGRKDEENITGPAEVQVSEEHQWSMQKELHILAPNSGERFSRRGYGT